MKPSAINRKCGRRPQQAQLSRSTLKATIALALLASIAYVPQYLANPLLEQTSSPIRDLRENTLTSGLQQDARSFAFYRFSTGTRPTTSYFVVLVDPEDGVSDPDVFISKTNTMPKSELDSDFACVKASSTENCITSKNYATANTILYIGIRCINACTYSLKVQYVGLALIPQSSSVTTVYLDGRQVSAYQYTIPSVAQDGWPIDSVQFSVDSSSSTTPINLFLSLTDDFSTIDEKDNDLVTDSGKTLRFGSGDLSWCISCPVFLLVSTKMGGNYRLNVRALSKRDSLIEMSTLQKSYNTVRGTECMFFQATKPNFDVVFSVRTQQSDTSQYLITLRNISSERTLPFTDVANIQTLTDAAQKQFIIRSIDRVRLQNSLQNISLCVNAFNPSTSSVSVEQRQYANRFELVDDVQNVFMLGSTDNVYFRITSPTLAAQQNIIIYLQAMRLNTTNNNAMSVLVAPPRIAVFLCRSSVDSECTLSDSVASQGSSPMSIITGVVDQNSQTRTIALSHSPSSCVDPNSCIYLISVINSDQLPANSLMRVTMKVTLTANLEPRALPLASQVVNQIPMFDSDFYQVTFSPLQLTTWNITRINIRLTSINGRVELYASNRIKQPAAGSTEYSSVSMNSVNRISLDVSAIADMTNYTLYIAVSALSQVQYSLRVDAEYSNFFPQSTLVGTGQATITPPILGQVIQDKVATLSTLTNPTLMNQMFTYIVPNFTVVPGQQRVIIATARSASTNETLSFFTFNGTRLGITTLHSSSSRPIYYTEPQPGETIYFGLRLFLQNPTRPNTTTSQQVIVSVMSVLTPQQKTEPKANAIDLPPTNSSFIEGYLTRNQILVYRTMLLDTNSSFRFNLRNTFGSMALMVLHANGQYNTARLLQANTDTYNYIANSNSFPDIITLSASQTDRERVNQLCRNASFTVRGGNENCTIYQSIQCLSDVCAFNYSINVTTTQNATLTLAKPVPRLLQENQVIQDTVASNGAQFFFVPYFYNRSLPTANVESIAFTLQKFIPASSTMVRDCAIVARVVSNAQLAYQQWNYPSLQSFDSISRGGISSPNELIDFPLLNITARCPVNSSCVLLIGVFGLSPLSASTYNLTYLSAKNKLNLTSFVADSLSDSIDSTNTSIEISKTFWFTMPTRVVTRGISSIFNWTQVLLVGGDFTQTANVMRDVDLSITVGRYPINDQDVDYVSVLGGPDYIALTSTDPLITRYTSSSQSRVLIVATIKGPGLSPFTLMNMGPSGVNETIFNYTDITLLRNGSVVFPTRISLDPVVRVYRFYSYGLRDVQFNITCSEGAVQVLANSQVFRNPTGERNAFLNFPMLNQTSKIKALTLTKGQNTVIRATLKNNTNLLWCTNCWYYITIVSHVPSVTVRHAATVVVSEIRDNNTQSVAIVQTNSWIRNFAVFNSSFAQFRYTVDSKAPMVFNATFNISTGLNVTLFIGLYADWQNNANLWNTSSLNTVQNPTPGQIQLRAKQSDLRFDVGNQYFITIVNPMRTQVIMNLTVQQVPDQTLLKPGQRLPDRMWTPSDYVKHYFLAPPPLYQNFTATVTITTKTPGFQPIVYLQRSDVVGTGNGNAFTPSTLRQATPQRFNTLFERPFYQALLTSYSFNVSLLNSPLITLTTQIVNGTPRTVAMTMYNQTYWSIGLYWVNHGFTDVQKAEFEITTRITPLGPQRVILSSTLHYLQNPDIIAIKQSLKGVMQRSLNGRLLNSEEVSYTNVGETVVVTQERQ